MAACDIAKFKIATFNYPIGVRIIGSNQIRERPLDPTFSPTDSPSDTIFARRIELRFSNTYCLDLIPGSRTHSGTRRGAGTVYLSKLSGETRLLLPRCDRSVIHHGRRDQLTGIAKCATAQYKSSRSGWRLQEAFTY